MGDAMELLPLLVLAPSEAAVLPGERRRLFLGEERMKTAARLARRDGKEVAVLAFDPAQRRQGEEPAAEPDRLLTVATASTLLRFEEDYAVVRGVRRVRIAGTSSGGCCDHDDPYADGTEAGCVPFVAAEGGAWEELAALLDGIDLLPQLRASSLEARIDRLARWLALQPWVAGEVLVAADLATRMELLADAAREISAPGASFRGDDLDAPYRDAEEHYEDLVREYEARARAQVAAGALEEDWTAALLRGQRIRLRRRAAALRVRAGRARVARRLEASQRAGFVPELERVRSAHGLAPRDLDALLVAGLGSHERFRDRLQQAARLLPPEEMQLGAWIEALEAGAFPT